MTLDEKIHFVLEQLNGSEGTTSLKEDIKTWFIKEKKLTIDDLDVHLIIQALTYHELITFHDDTKKHILTHLGRLMNESDGWKNFVLIERQKKQREQKKAENDLKISNWLVKSWWWPLAISIASIVISIFIKNCDNKKDKEETASDTQTQKCEPLSHYCPTIQPTTDSSKTVSADSSKRN